MIFALILNCIMKRFPALLPLALLMACFFAASPLHSQVDVTIKVKNMAAGKGKVYQVFGSQSLPFDSLLMNSEGLIRLQRPQSYPGGMYYFVLPDNSWFSLLMDADQTFTCTTLAGAVVDNMVIEGSEDNELLFATTKWETAFNKDLQPYQQAVNAAAKNSPEYFKALEEREVYLKRKEDYLAQLQREHPDAFFTKFKLQGQNPKLKYPRLPEGGLDTLLQTAIYKSEYWNQYDFSDDRLVRTPVFHNKLRTWVQDLTPQNPDTVIAACEFIMSKVKPGSEHFRYAINTLGIMYSAKHQGNSTEANKKPLMMGAEKVYIHLMEKYYTIENTPWELPSRVMNLQGELKWMKASQLGATGQDLTYTNVNGQTESLYGLQAPATIVYLYSHSCDHCRQQTPMLVNLLSQWKQKGLQVYAICIDPDAEKWKNFITTYHAESFHNFQDGNFLATNVKKYWVDITPEVYVLDANHKIVARDLRPDQLDPVLREILP